MSHVTVTVQRRTQKIWTGGANQLQGHHDALGGGKLRIQQKDLGLLYQKGHLSATGGAMAPLAPPVGPPLLTCAIVGMEGVMRH